MQSSAKISVEDNDYIIRSTQTITSEQLTTATYSYLTSIAKKMGKPAPQREAIGDIANETTTASRIHGSGWVIYGILTKTVTAGTVSNIEERLIELK